MTATATDFETISLTDVTRHFGRRRVLTRITVTFRAGDVVALLGPNGSGKSTLLSILATLITPSSGDVRYGINTARCDAALQLRSHVGWLGHEVSLYPELTARENLAFFAAMYGVTSASSRVENALSEARLTERAADPVGTYSRGMRQRLALERALLHDPRLVLLDEPFTGLDDASVALLVERLRGLGQRGCILIVATHDFDITEHLFNRAVVLRDGRLSELDMGGADLRASYREHMDVTVRAARG